MLLGFKRNGGEGGSHAEADYGSRSGSSCPICRSALWSQALRAGSELPGSQVFKQWPKFGHQLETITMLGVLLNWMNSDVFCNANINNNITLSTGCVLVTLLRALMDYLISFSL